MKSYDSKLSKKAPGHVSDFRWRLKIHVCGDKVRRFFPLLFTPFDLVSFLNIAKTFKQFPKKYNNLNFSIMRI